MTDYEIRHGARPQHIWLSRQAGWILFDETAGRFEILNVQAEIATGLKGISILMVNRADPNATDDFRLCNSAQPLV